MNGMVVSMYIIIAILLALLGVLIAPWIALRIAIRKRRKAYRQYRHFMRYFGADTNGWQRQFLTAVKLAQNSIYGTTMAQPAPIAQRRDDFYSAMRRMDDIRDGVMDYS